MKKTKTVYTVLGIQTPLWILVLLHLYVFWTAYWYAPNHDFWLYEVDGKQYIIQEEWRDWDIRVVTYIIDKE